jgi:hypothetical protein
MSVGTFFFDRVLIYCTDLVLIAADIFTAGLVFF